MSNISNRRSKWTALVLTLALVVVSVPIPAAGAAGAAVPAPAPQTAGACQQSHRGGTFDLANFRRRSWGPAIEAGGIARPARIYDLRSTFASYALAAGISVFELARIMGTSIAMIERHYGTLIEGANADIACRLDASAPRSRRLARDWA